MKNPTDGHSQVFDPALRTLFGSVQTHVPPLGVYPPAQVVHVVADVVQVKQLPSQELQLFPFKKSPSRQEVH